VWQDVVLVMIVQGDHLERTIVRYVLQTDIGLKYNPLAMFNDPLIV